MKRIVQHRFEKKRRVRKNWDAAFFRITAEPKIEKLPVSI
jgi:hypothetical protein